jgi:uncharacterized protein GlcG (DUF336 family)
MRRPARKLQLEPLEQRDLPDAAADLVFLTHAYQDVLGRPIDSSGQVYFSNLLSQGSASRQQVALALLQSPENRARETVFLYQEILHRNPDPAGFNGLTRFLSSGGTLEQASAILAGSAEYFQLHGSNAAGFLSALYADLLQRGIDPSGQAHFSRLLGSNTSRTQVAGAILSSAEYRQDVIDTFYVHFLGRHADSIGLSFAFSALQSGARDERVAAAILASQEYAPSDPPGDPGPTLTATDVQTLLERAAAASASTDAIIAIVDRSGRVLGVRAESGVSPTLMADPVMRTFAVDGALAEARTGAFFANDQAPLTSRTIRFISQTTMTEREINSNPDIADPNSPLSGPGFVAPIGLGGHFPPGVPFTPQVDLFAIEHTNRDSILHPGADGLKTSTDNIVLPSRFNVDLTNIPASIPTNERLQPPESYGLISGIDPYAQSRGIGTLPGGIPIFKNGHVVGGIGVFFPGSTGYATEENSSLDAKYNPAKRDRAFEAEFIAFAALGGSAAAGAAVGTLGGIAPVSGISLPFGRIDLVGITLDIFGPGGNQGPANLLGFGNTLGRGNPNDGTDLPVDIGGDQYLSSTPVPDGWLVTPHDGLGITATDVVRIITQGIAQANLTRAAIRLPLGSRTEMVFSVADRAGNVLGLYRMPDATVFSLDVAVAKSRNVSYYADKTQLQPVDQAPGVPPGVAFSNRTFRFLALPHFPEGIDAASPGPFSILNDPGTNSKTGLNVGPAQPASAFQSVQGYDAFHPGTNFRDPTNPANQNGIVFFPGAVPLYKDVNGNGHPVLVGGLGVSGDGVDQDDVVTAAAANHYTPPPNILTADQVAVYGVNLPYQKFDRNPGG